MRLPGTLMALAGAAATGWLAGAMFGAAGRRCGRRSCYATMLLPYARVARAAARPRDGAARGRWRSARSGTRGTPTSTPALARWTLVAGVAAGAVDARQGPHRRGPRRRRHGGVAAVDARLVVAARRRRGGRGGHRRRDRLAVVRGDGARLARLPALLLRRSPRRRHGRRHAAPCRPAVLVLPADRCWPARGRGLSAAVAARAPRASDAERLLWSWLLADVVLLSLAGSKLATYLLPALPAVAVLAALRLAGTSRRRDRRRLATRAGGGRCGRGTRVSARGGRMGGLVDRPPCRLRLDVGAAPGSCWAWSGARPDAGARSSAAGHGVGAAGRRPGGACRPWPNGSPPSTRRANQRRGTICRPGCSIVDEGVGSFVFYLRPELRRGLTAGRVRASRGSRCATSADRDGVRGGHRRRSRARRRLSFTTLAPAPIWRDRPVPGACRSTTSAERSTTRPDVAPVRPASAHAGGMRHDFVLSSRRSRLLAAPWPWRMSAAAAAVASFAPRPRRRRPTRPTARASQLEGEWTLVGLETLAGGPRVSGFLRYDRFANHHPARRAGGRRSGARGRRAPWSPTFTAKATPPGGAARLRRPAERGRRRSG